MVSAVMTRSQQPSTDRTHSEREALAIGLAQLDTGKSVPVEDVEAWVATWGDANELPKPEPR